MGKFGRQLDARCDHLLEGTTAESTDCPGNVATVAYDT